MPPLDESRASSMPPLDDAMVSPRTSIAESGGVRASLVLTSVPAEMGGETAAFMGSFRRNSLEAITPSPGAWSVATTERSLMEGAPSTSLQRSKKLLQALHTMRRLARERRSIENETESFPKAKHDGDAEGSLLENTLTNIADTAEQLVELEELIIRHVGYAAEAGGVKHASTAMTWRVLEVVRRKKALLQAAEARAAALDAEVARNGELLHEVIGGKLEKPTEVIGSLEFITSVTHPGKLANANRTNFVEFTSTFKLPAEHSVLVRMRRLRADTALWWAKACLAEAEKGTDYRVLKHLSDIAQDAGLDKEHPLMFRARRIMLDRVADWALEQALLAQQRIQGLKDSEVSTIAEDALKVEDSIESAVKEGVSEADHRIRQARAAVKAMRDADFARRRKEKVAQKKQQRGSRPAAAS